jgi:hypothetical protein
MTLNENAIRLLRDDDAPDLVLLLVREIAREIGVPTHVGEPLTAQKLSTENGELSTGRGELSTIRPQAET